MSRKYLEDIIPKEEIFGYHDESDERHAYWCEQEKIYGFCDMETWDLDVAFAQLIYERLMMYKEIGGKVIDLTFYKFEYNGKQYTELELIDIMIEDCKLAMKYGIKIEHSDIMEEVYEILKLCHKTLWW